MRFGKHIWLVFLKCEDPSKGAIGAAVKPTVASQGLTWALWALVLFLVIVLKSVVRPRPGKACLSVTLIRHGGLTATFACLGYSCFEVMSGNGWVRVLQAHWLGSESGVPVKLIFRLIPQVVAWRCSVSIKQL